MKGSTRLSSMSGALIFVLTACQPLQTPGQQFQAESTTSFRDIVTPVNTRQATQQKEETEVASPSIEIDLQESDEQAVVAKAVEDLARHLSIGVDQITVLEVRKVVWPDSSLGCPVPNGVYAQVPQAGLLTRLGAGGQMYFYHSGVEQAPFLCTGTTRILPDATPTSDEFVPPPDSEID